MKKNFLTGLILLALAVPAGAKHEYYDEDRYRIERVAYELKDASAHFYREIKRSLYHDGYGEDYALRSFYRFKEKTEAFHCALADHPEDRYLLKRYFSQLYQAYLEADQAFRHLDSCDDHLARDFYRAQSLMRDLSQYFGYRRGYGHGKYGYEHGGYEHGDYRDGDYRDRDDHHRDRRRPRIRFKIEWPGR